LLSHRHHRGIDPLGHLQRIANKMLSDNPDSFEAVSRGEMFRVHAEAAFCIYLMLVLKSNRKKLHLVKPGVIENRRRSDKGKSRIPEYHRVTMDPDWAPGPAKA
jgi:hypothetical protein